MRLVGELAHALLHLRIAGGQRPQRLDVLHQAHRLGRLGPLGLSVIWAFWCAVSSSQIATSLGMLARLAIERLDVAVELVEAAGRP